MSSLEGGFPPVDFETWRRKVEADLRGADFDEALAYGGLDDLGLRALEHESTAPTASDPGGLPGVAPFTRGAHIPGDGPAAWKVALTLDTADPAVARRHLFHDLSLGVGSLWLRLGSPGRDGGVGIRGLEDFRTLLDGVDLSIVDVMLDAGDPRLAAALLDKLVDDPSALSGSLAGDPIGAWASGRVRDLDAAFERLAAATAWCRGRAPGLGAFHADGVLWHDKGASPVQELALTLAATVETLRRLDGFRIEPSDFAAQLRAVFAVGRRNFLEIAKLRAWRLLLSKVLKAGGVDDAAPRLAVAPGRIHLTRVDPWVNLLRATAQTFTAACAGADLIVTPRYDQLWGDGDAEARSRRYSINLQHVLAQEAHLGRVADPAGGSWALERMTDDLARSAWDLFRDYEAAGGLVACLRAGRVHADLRATVAERRVRLAKRLDPIIGVSYFPNLDERRPAGEPPPPTTVDRADGSGAAASPLIEPALVDSVAAALVDGAP
ncbi:MAG: methylmalonyl-CoA mutase family protein, partial [Acidobacteriota bacterium]